MPNQWSGSVQQYYHFLLGYLAPVLLWLEKSKADRITVRDCGPMNPWFERVLNQEDVEVMQVGHFLHVFAGKLQPCTVLRGLDFPDEFDTKRLGRFRQLVYRRLAVTEVRPSQVSVLDRTTTDPFYFTSASEIDLAGASRRSTPTLGKWASSFADKFPMDYFDPTDLDITEQISRFSRTATLVGQHGAGLTNMVFMRPGGTVIEIHPPLPGEVRGLFEKLATACGHTYIQIPQADVHGDFDVAALKSAIIAHS